ncbi:hypothetical protein ACFW6S_21170 [Streptomyces sp. NPDC058740]|uniref:hypothetical protein n=1 Tax=Streptomyces sp. NPDC058740 TaxID=3346619 RepID=UPI003679EC15
MRSTGGSGGRRHRWGRVGAPLLLLVPLLAVTAASAPDEAEAGPRAADAGDVRIAYAGTRHRSLGRVADKTSTTPLFGDGPAHLDVQPAASGDLMVFAGRRDEKTPQVYLRAADGTVTRLTHGLDAANPRLTPDGRTVVFDSAPPGGGPRDLWRVATDGSALTRLTDTPADEVHPTVSPEGGRLAYVSDADPVVGRQVYVRPLDGGAATLVSDPTQGTAGEPVWNPVDDAENRDVIAYTATGPGGPRLRWADGRTGVGGPLLSGTQAQWRTHGAAWLPDGDGLLFLSPDRTCDCEGDWDHVFRVTAHSADPPAVVLSEDREIGPPTWLGPLDGGGVVVERTSAPGPHEVTLQDIRSDGSDPRDLGLRLLKEDPAADTTTDPAKDPLFRPAPGFDPWTERQNYTPDGRRIVVTRFEDSPDGRIERILLADADGTNEAALPLAGRGPRDWDTDPTYSPDGRFLAFTRTSPGGVGDASGPGRILIADASTGALRGEIVPPAGQARGGDAQPTWSSDGTTLAFTRSHVINGNGGNKHIWTVPVEHLDRQHDLSADMCPAGCEVIDDSPAFSPDGTVIAFNRKSGGGRVDERNGLLLASPAGGAFDAGCRVLLPDAARDVPGACHRELPDTTATGPFQPRDAAWTPDGASLVLSARAEVAANSPEKLYVVDVATGARTPLTAGLPGRQKEPAVQQSVDLAVVAPGTVPPSTVGEPGTVRVDVVNHGPAASPGTRLTVAPPLGLTVTGIGAPGATCDAAALTCALGVVPPGATVPVDVTFTGSVPGNQPVDWSVTGAVLDPRPSDNSGRTVVPVREVQPTPTPTPSPTSPPTSTPTTPPPSPSPPAPPEPPSPQAGPGVRISAQPNPGYVGGRVVLTYTVRNGRNALATGLRLRIGLPPGVPHNGPPPGCDGAWNCALPDLAPGARTVLQVVLSPDRAFTARVTGRLTTSGTDADLRDNTARQRIRVLQPRIVAVPPIGKPGFVTSVRGKDFPPGVPVRFTWRPGITAAAAPTVPGADGSFIGQLLILAKDQTGPRVITAGGPGFSPVRTDFLVVSGTIQPPDVVARR